jgi:hypothetical protein
MNESRIDYKQNKAKQKKLHERKRKANERNR